MKKIVRILLVLVALALLWTFISGLIPVTNVYIADFSVSADGTELTFTAQNASSMGFLRAFRDEGGGVKPHYLKFLSAWGGFNSSLGAKNRFTLQLDPADTEIYVYHGSSGYDLALRKASDGTWQRAAGK